MNKPLTKLMYALLLIFYSVTGFAQHTFNDLNILIQNASGDSLKKLISLAHAYHKECLKTKDAKLIAQSTYLLGYAYSETEYEKARKYLNESLKYSFTINDSILMADSWYLLGMVDYFSFKNEEALDYLQMALQQYLKSNLENKQANTFCKIGMIYDEINKSGQSLRYYKRAVLIYTHLANNLEVAKINHNIGVVYSKSESYDKALEYYKESLKYFEKEGFTSGIAAVINNMGVIHDKKGETEKALEFYKKALEIYNDLRQIRAIVISNFNVGETYKNLRNYEMALQYFNTGLDISLKYNIADYISNNYIELSEVYEDLNDFQTALLYHKKYFDINDSLNKALDEETFATYESEIDHQLTTRELALKTQKLNRKTLVLYLFVFGAFLFLVVTVLLYIEKRKNVKVQKELVEHKDHLERLVKRKTDELEIEISERKVAEESDKLKSAFLANMSHEIRTPMNSIISFSRYLKDPELSDEKRNEYIQYIISCGRNLLQLINDILDIAKMDAYKLRIHLESCNVSNLLNETYEIFKESKVNELNSIEFNLNTFSIHDNIIIESDYNRLKQVFTNLLENAFKYTTKGSIEFGIEKIKYNLIFFYIKDTGSGIPLGKSKLIFERFQQAETALDKKSRGAGLGLAICKNLIEMLGGKIWLESKPNEGSVFRFTIPNSKPVLKNINNHQRRVKSIKPRKSFDWSDKNILIAEDEELNFKVLQVALKKTGVNILRAKTGNEAISITLGQPVDLILMDIQMPEKDGFQATREIKTRLSVPIIAQTSFAMNEDKQKCMDAGCDDFITKPLDINDLLHKIEKHLRVKTMG